jgi:hypothetical protein
MNPTFYWMVPFVAFAGFLFILGLWTTHGIRKRDRSEARSRLRCLVTRIGSAIGA